MEDIIKHREKVSDNILKSFEINIEKARSGVYADTAENRKLNRVGQQYGSKKQEDEPKGEQSSKQEENSGSKNSKSIEEHAKNTSDEVLKKVITNKNAPEDLKNEARNELARRQGLFDTKSNNKTQKKEDSSLKSFSEGSKFFDAYYKIVESDLDFEPYIEDINNYVEKHNLGLDGKNQEADFNKLPLSHKTALANLMKKSMEKFTEDSKKKE